MKKIRRVIFTLFSTAFLLSVCLNAYAADQNYFLQQYRAAPGCLQLDCSALEGAKPEMFTAELGGQEIPVAALDTAEAENLATTVYCLVDISGSMHAEQMEYAQNVLRALAAQMGETDHLVIGTLGNQLTHSKLLSTKEEMEEAISALAADSHEDTNLYAGIVESLHFLTTDTGVDARRCLMILSDGEDDQKSGITQNEADKAVQASGVPVYTVATLRNAPTQAQQEYAKILGSFARLSTGGEHFAPQLDDLPAEQVAQRIWEHCKNGLVLTLDTSGFASAKDELLLRVTYTEGQTSYADTLTIYTKDLLPAEQPEPVSTPAPAAEAEPQAGFPTVAVIIGILVVLAVVIVAVVLVQKRKKEAERAAAEKEAEEARRRQEEEERKKQEQQAALLAGNSAEPPVQPRTVQGYELLLTAIGYENIVRRLRLPEGKEQTVGRTDKADIVLDASDKRLSGVHCSLSCTNGILRVMDRRSTNGTSVNGVPTVPMGIVIVPNGSFLRMGSYEYRVEIKKATWTV